MTPTTPILTTPMSMRPTAPLALSTKVIFLLVAAAIISCVAIGLSIYNSTRPEGGDITDAFLMSKEPDDVLLKSELVNKDYVDTQVSRGREYTHNAITTTLSESTSGGTTDTVAITKEDVAQLLQTTQGYLDLARFLHEDPTLNLIRILKGTTWQLQFCSKLPPK